MDHEQQESLKQLKTFIESNISRRFPPKEATPIFEADLLWDASRFWAQVIFAATPAVSPKTLRDLEIFAAEYAEEIGIKININDLLNEHWLRLILGSVRVSHGIQHILPTYEKVRDSRKELEFLSHFYNQKSAERHQMKVPISEMQAAMAEYESKQNCTLNKTTLFSSPWARINDNQVEISAIDIYLDPILQHWGRLEFLSRWESNNNGPEDVLSIGNNELESILQSFSHFKDAPSLLTFPAIPSVTVKENSYDFSVNQYQPSYPKGMLDKIAGLLWEMLIRDETFPNDKARLMIWVSNILIQSNWPEHLTYVSFNSKQRFLDTALALLLEQEDIKDCEKELSRVFLDTRAKVGAEVLFKKIPTIFDSYPLNNENLFELYQSFYTLDHQAHANYFYEQHSRHELKYFVHCIVRQDTEPNILAGVLPTGSCPRIKTLLRHGLTYPFFVWSVTHGIRHHRPGVLPFLLIEPDLCTLALCLIDRFEYSGDQQDKITDAWLIATRLLLQSLPPAEQNKERCSAIVFQLFRQLNAGKYSLPANNSTQEQRTQTRQLRNGRQQQVLELIENHPLSKGRIFGAPSRYLLPELFDSLRESFVQYRERHLYRNGTVQFPMLQWDGLFWLLKLTTYWKYRETFSGKPVAGQELAKTFLQQYLANLEQKEIQIFDYFEGKKKMDTPLWSERIERLELLDWIYPIYTIYKIDRLNSFLFPRIDFEAISEHYDRRNEFIAGKLRTHVGVLLQVLRKLVLPAIPYGFEKASLLEIKEQIEQQVVTYIRQYSRDLPLEDRMDIFSYQKEQSLHQLENEALLPQVARAINWFSKKEEIITALLSTGDIVKILVLLDYITVEGIKHTLIEKIKSTELVTFLSDKNWIPEIQTVLAKIAHYPELLPQLEQAADFWRVKITDRRKEQQYKVQLFIADLLIAYFKKDSATITSLPEPGPFAGAMHEMNYYGYKQFYQALLYLENQPDKANQLFSDLATQYPTYPTISLNRMAAKLKMAGEKHDLTLYRGAYEEWTEQAKKHFSKSTIASLEPTVSANLMTILYEMGDLKQLDEIFNKLDLPDRMAPAIIEIRVKSLRVQQKIAEALSLIDTAKTYHQFADAGQIQFLSDLETEVKGIDNIDELKVQYHRIFSSTPSKLIRILPEAFNGMQEIYAFLVKEIAKAASKMLDKIKTIEKIDNEDKYNDVVELILDSRINVFGWHISAQSRGGHSASTDKSDGIQPGERDLPIMDSNKQLLLNCEAFVYRGATNAGPHLEKIFNYYHQRKAITVLIYDTAERKAGFDANWEKYTMEIIPAIKFPPGMELTEPIVDVSAVFEFDESAIKIGRSLHGPNTVIYHVFVNIQYKLN